jgi:hypothetical protein
MQGRDNVCVVLSFRWWECGQSNVLTPTRPCQARPDRLGAPQTQTASSQLRTRHGKHPAMAAKASPVFSGLALSQEQIG